MTDESKPRTHAHHSPPPWAARAVRLSLRQRDMLAVLHTLPAGEFIAVCDLGTRLGMDSSLAVKTAHRLAANLPLSPRPERVEIRAQTRPMTIRLRPNHEKKH